MKRYLPGLHFEAQKDEPIPGGLFLVQVRRVSHHWNRQKPFFRVHFTILEPKQFADRDLEGRVYSTEKALWKLSWFLRAFGYDQELLSRDEVDEKALIGLRGVVQVGQVQMNGRSYLNLDAFASAGEWDELSLAATSVGQKEAGDGL
jgi:hypothetical protein